MRYMKIGTLISAGVLMLSSMILNSGCSEAGNGRKQTTENPGAIFGEVKLSLIHISEPTRLKTRSRMPSSA